MKKEYKIQLINEAYDAAEKYIKELSDYKSFEAKDMVRAFATGYITGKKREAEYVENDTNTKRY